MVALAWLLIIALAALLVVRLGTTALVLTGLPAATSEFQSYSAFFGVGFTTRESEQVVNHPVRRRIVQHLILAGQIGLTSVIVPLVVTFVNVKSMRDGVEQLGLIALSLAVGWIVTNTALFKRLVDKSIQFALRRAGALRHELDHAVLLRLDHGFAVAEVAIEAGDPLAGRSLARADLDEHGVVVLGLARDDGGYVAAPRRETVLRVGDVLTLYGHGDAAQTLRAAVAEVPVLPVPQVGR